MWQYKKHTSNKNKQLRNPKVIKAIKFSPPSDDANLCDNPNGENDRPEVGVFDRIRKILFKQLEKGIFVDIFFKAWGQDLNCCKDFVIQRLYVFTAWGLVLHMAFDYCVNFKTLWDSIRST
ncbi:hypothetical protein K7X08_008593 [Anisodus acutangulus]|uniref:Uncharacterized protein n=1 Tax=Anisodus acutangulus TaxID=402998 RepID=A0A9Q1RPB9_9SOLA|nr:hypothetical protein K7X08_008593 [Anisodus acutangulus]